MAGSVDGTTGKPTETPALLNTHIGQPALVVSPAPAPAPTRHADEPSAPSSPLPTNKDAPHHASDKPQSQGSDRKPPLMHQKSKGRTGGRPKEEPKVATAAPTGRNLVLCFDGTSNRFGETNTNVVKLFEVLKRDKEEKQMVYYQTGIGTYASPGFTTPIMLAVAKFADLAIAWFLNEHVMGGYKYLMQHYKAGDRIFLFGFSRGAYIARALAGMLHKVGLLPPSMTEQVPFAYKMFADSSKKNEELARDFKQTFGRNITVHFVGVWDTVSSVGLLYPRNLPFTTSNKSIVYFRHALSLDERRAKFKPNLYHNPPRTAEDVREGPPEAKPLAKSTTARLPTKSEPAADNAKEGAETAAWNKRVGPYRLEAVKEVWFAGGHADVGGGNVKNHFPYRLSNLSLQWMIGEAYHAGLHFDMKALERENVMPKERAEMNWDAHAQAHDQLKKSWAWWILEVIPFTHRYQDAGARWHSQFGLVFCLLRCCYPPALTES
ncbi:hypothetical protein BOTBODRAFT_153759 [Botryobasidium botryosum FD-172 SS1]|uniref:T6SS Phospholipase effector Tle1-like catalytic domain-containing protein n=1 Tax=Botryobasidium botryosum (strain FD-172 SS1) TaxID=930990 RepID=A0A067MT33_BOTB1|nr:hypothetical protein BOTBODRAFT_153759 [Botryobasidium botryosum FD-172 SS1]